MDTRSAVRKISVGKDKISKLYYQQNQDNSLVVIFPDENYNADKPLLYYARKAALSEGNDVLCISYKRRLTWRDMGIYTVDLEADSSTDAVKRCLKKTYKNIYFISKGIGTEVAGVVSNRLGYEKIRSIFLTPTNYAIKHIVNSRSLVVVGTKDSIFTPDCIDKIQGHKNVEVISIEDANHCLEVPGDIERSLEILEHMVEVYMSFLKEVV